MLAVGNIVFMYVLKCAGVSWWKVSVLIACIVYCEGLFSHVWYVERMSDACISCEASNFSVIVMYSPGAVYLF